MATKKKLLQAAAGTAAASGGAGALNVEDVFSTYLYEGNGSAQTIDNGVNLGQSNDGGSAYFDGTNADGLVFADDADLQFGTGEFCIECWIWADKLGTNSFGGIIAKRDTGTSYWRLTYQHSDTSINFNSSLGGDNVSYTFTTTGQWVHLAVTRDSSNTLRLFENGILKDSTPIGTNNYNFTTPLRVGALTGGTNYAFEGHISNVRVVKGSAVYTSNFTPSTSPLTAITNTSLLTAQGDTPFADNSVNAFTATTTGAKASTFGPFDAADAGEGGLVWIKARTGVRGGQIYDTERGVTKRLVTTGTDAESTLSNGLTSFNASGFTLGGHATVNQGLTYASWTFRKAPKFFDVVTYTGNGTAGRTISHNLGTTVGCIIVKRTSSAQNWAVYHRGNTAAPETDVLYLNLTDATTDLGSVWYDTAPTSTEFTLGDQIGVNANGETYVAYLFAHNDGDGDFGDGTQDIIKCGSFTGTGATNNFVNLGFEPQFIMFKSASVSEDWFMFDNMRGTTVGNDVALYANLSNGDGSPYDNIDFNATGFTLKDTYWGNRSGSDYIYIAIRRGPMAVPTDATDVFGIDTRAGGTPSYISNFPVDMGWKRTVNAGSQTYVASRLTGTSFLATASTSAESSDTGFVFDYMNGWADDGLANSNVYSWMWRRAPSFCDVVAYTGNGTAGRTVSHNLGVAPEMMWVKRRDSADNWTVYHSALGNDKWIPLNQTAAALDNSNGTRWYLTTPTDSVFTLGIEGSVNGSGGDYIAYLFASLDGVSKVGSYTGNGGTGQTIDCGFSSGARFVLIKNYFATGENWIVFDSERGIVSGNDALLSLNTTDSEITNSDLIDPHPSGFSLPNGFGEVNSDGHTYIFYAIA